MKKYGIKYYSLLRGYLKNRPNLQRIADNIGWLFFDRIIRMGVGLFVGVWVARYLGPAQYGLLNFAMAFVALFAAISTLGLNSIVVQAFIIQPDRKNEILGSAFMMQLFGGMALLLSVVVAITWLRPQDETVKLMVAVLGSVMVLKSTEVIKYWFESQVLLKYTVWVENIIFLIIASVKVAMILLKMPLMAFVWVMFIEAALVSVGLVVIFISQGGSVFKWQARFDRVKSLLKDSWPIILSTMAVMIYMRIDQIMLGQMIGDEAVGIYSAAVRISEVWYFIPVAITVSVFPAVIEAKKNNEDDYCHKLQKLYDLMVVMALSVALPMTLLSDWLIMLLFGQAYAKAGTVLAIHIWGGIFVFFGTAWSRWIILEGLQSTMLMINVMALTANIILNFVLIPKYGIVGAAAATAISYSLGHTVFALFFKNQRKAVIMLIRTLFSFRRIMPWT